MKTINKGASMDELLAIIGLFLLIAFLMASSQDKGFCWSYNDESRCIKIGEDLWD